MTETHYQYAARALRNRARTDLAAAYTLADNPLPADTGLVADVIESCGPWGLAVALLDVGGEVMPGLLIPGVPQLPLPTDAARFLATRLLRLADEADAAEAPA